MKNRIIIILLMLFIANSIYAVENTKHKKLSAAVLQFKNINCSQNIAEGFTEIFTGKLFNENIFILLERKLFNLTLKKVILKNMI